MSPAMYWTSMALYCGFMLMWGWLFAGVPHGGKEIAFCVAGHGLFLSIAVKAMSTRWEKKE